VVIKKSGVLWGGRRATGGGVLKRDTPRFGGEPPFFPGGEELKGGPPKKDDVCSPPSPGSERGRSSTSREATREWGDDNPTNTWGGRGY